MKTILQSISHFQGEISHNLKSYKEKLFHLEYDINLALAKLNFPRQLKACGATKGKGYPLNHIFFAMLLSRIIHKFTVNINDVI